MTNYYLVVERVGKGCEEIGGGIQWDEKFQTAGFGQAKKSAHLPSLEKKRKSYRLQFGMRWRIMERKILRNSMLR